MERALVSTSQHDITSKHKHASQQSRIFKTLVISIIPEWHSLLWHTKEEETGKENGVVYFSIKSTLLSGAGCQSAH